MNTHRMKLLGMGTLTLLTLASCGGDTDSGGAEEAPPPVRVEFQAVGASAAEGTVTLTLEGGTYAAVVAIDTHRGPGEYPIEIHSGSCAANGPLVVELTPVDGQEGGEGQARSSFAASELPPGGSYYVELRDAQDGSLIGCGDLPAL